MPNTDDRPAAEGIPPGHFPASPVEPGHTEPCPRRVRAQLNDQWVLDSTAVMYLWEHPYYPRYLIPVSDISLGDLPTDSLESAGSEWPDHRLVEWDAVDRWFEEDEEVFVHARSPFVRVDAIMANRQVRFYLGDTLLADSPGCAIVFETGLPPRYYVPKSAVDWSVLEASSTVSECPYKGTTSGYWNAVVDQTTTADIAWSYDFPTIALAPIAGLVAFYEEKLRLVLS